MPHMPRPFISKALLTAAGALLLGLTLSSTAAAATTWEWGAPWVWSVPSRLPASGHTVSLLAPGPSGSVYAIGREAITRLATFARIDGETAADDWSVSTKGPSRRGVLPAAAAVDPGGNLIVAGSCGRGRGMDLWVVKVKAGSGRILWQKTWNGAARRADAAKAVAVDARGNIYAAGNTDAASGRGDGVVVKYDPNGRKRWAYRLQTGGDDGFTACAVDSVSSLYVTGSRRARGALSQVVTIKLGSGGTARWRRQFTTLTGACVGKFVSVGAESVAVAGLCESAADGALTPIAMTFDPLGTALWSYTGEDAVTSLGGMAVDAAGRIGLAGSVATDAHVKAGWVQTLLPDPSGEVTWSATYSFAGGDPATTYGSSFSDVGVDSAGNLYCAGALVAYTEGVGESRALLVRYPAPENGVAMEPDAVWTYPAPTLSTPVGGFGSVAVAGDDEVYAGGYQEYTRGLRGMVHRARIVAP